MEKKTDKKMIVFWTLASIIYAVIVHVLFYLKAPKEFLIANWSAGEILTYTSTVSLGLLAVWQNKRFKDENDEAQKRLESLTEKANELSSINKIIEIENERLNQIKEAMDDFENKCNARRLIIESRKDTSEESTIAGMELEHNINQSYNRLRKVLRVEFIHGKDGSNQAVNAINDYYEKTKALVFIIQNDRRNIEKNVNTTALNAAKNTYRDQCDEYIQSMEKRLDQVIYGNMSLSDIKTLYSDRVM